MSRITLRPSALTAFLDTLPRSVLKSASPTHLPTQLPLALPSPLHTTNLIAILHLVFSTLSSPAHAAYFGATGSDPRETAVRGVMGLFLASEDGWGVDNLLSTTAWKKGLLGEDKVVEFFGITVMREKQHETMKGITVGERWQPGVNVSGALVDLFRGLGGKVPGRCVGEAVEATIRQARETAGKGPAWAADMAKTFCAEVGLGIAWEIILADVQVVGVERSLADSYMAPSGTVLPAAPLRLLQDLAYRQSQSDDLSLPLPSPVALSNLSPLPLPTHLLLILGIFDLPPYLPGGSALEGAISTWQSHDIDILSLAQGTSSESSRSAKRATETIQVPTETLRKLQTASVEACREIWAESRFSENKEKGAGGEDWKRNMSMADVARVCERLQGCIDREGLGVMMAPTGV